MVMWSVGSGGDGGGIDDEGRHSGWIDQAYRRLYESI